MSYQHVQDTSVDMTCLMPSYVQELRIEEQVMFNLWWRNDGHQFLLSMWNSQVSPSGLKFIEDKNTHRLMLMTFASHDVSWSLKPTNLRSRGGQRTESLLQHHGNLSKTSSKTSWDHLYSRNACAKLASPNQQHSTALITGKQRFCSVFSPWLPKLANLKTWRGRVLRSIVTATCLQVPVCQYALRVAWMAYWFTSHDIKDWFAETKSG